MTSPIHSVSSAFKAAIQPVIGATTRALTPPGSGNPAPALPDVPPPAPPASDPSAKPGKKSQQSSFLSGVAGSALNQGSGASGKTLLGQ